MIEFQHVTKRYGNGYLGLDNVNFHLAQGEFAFLTGHSGAGKSTVLKLIAAMEAASFGQVLIDNQSIQGLKNQRIPWLRRQMGIILQSPNLLMDRTVFDNAALPLVVSGYPYYDIQSRVRAMLSKVSLYQKAHCYPYELSTGEQQRVAIARAVINKPPILLADEPTGNLDPGLAAEIMDLFCQFNQLGMTILIASHDMALIGSLRRRILHLSGGKLIAST